MTKISVRTLLWNITLALVLLISVAGCNASSPFITSTPQPTAMPSATTTPLPTLSPSQTLTPEPTSTPSPTVTPSPTQVPEHRIGVRFVDGLGEFYDKENGLKFVPRGMNYARVDHIVGGGNWHSTFDPALYDPNKIDQAFLQMESDGYNLVRVFIDCCSAPGEQVGDPKGGLSSTYLEKVVDFLQRAKTHHIYVILCIDLTPGEGGYNDPLWKAINAKIDGENVRYLTRGGLVAKTNYVTDFVQGLIDHPAPLEAVFAYDLTNEVHFDANMPPLSLAFGLVSTVNGKTYDMAKPDEKESMVNDNLIYWIDHLRESIRQLDPTALVATSFFVPQKPVATRLGDSRFILTEAVIAQSQADFIDLHPYPGWGLSLSQYARNFGITANTPKPILMGEFGVSTSIAFSAAGAARILQNWQIESCQYGYDGWLLWTWDTEDTLGFWNALSQNSEIEKALAPINRPDPCQ